MKNFVMTVIAVAVTLAAYEWYKRIEVKKHIAAAYISEGLTLASGVKNHVAGYYQDKGKLPSSNADVGLPPAGQFVGASVAGLEITERGVITIRYNDKSGVKEGILKLIPDVSKPHMGISWLCTTPSFKGIETWAPQCKFQP